MTPWFLVLAAEAMYPSSTWMWQLSIGLFPWEYQKFCFGAVKCLRCFREQ